MARVMSLPMAADWRRHFWLALARPKLFQSVVFARLAMMTIIAQRASRHLWPAGIASEVRHLRDTADFRFRNPAAINGAKSRSSIAMDIKPPRVMS